MRYDFWRSEREKAEVVEPFGVRVLRHSVGKAESPVLKIWRPKATKPTVNFRFGSAGQREQFVERWLADFAAAEARKDERRATALEHADKVQVGTIFTWSWGYDQTNVNCFEVVEKRGLRVVVREIGQDSAGSTGPYAENVVPVPGAFLKKAEPQTKVLQFTPEGAPYLSQPYGWCGVWSGSPVYRSWYA